MFPELTDWVVIDEPSTRLRSPPRYFGCFLSDFDEGVVIGNGVPEGDLHDDRGRISGIEPKSVAHVHGGNDTSSPLNMSSELAWVLKQPRCQSCRFLLN
jgi:hypothetical protein